MRESQPQDRGRTKSLGVLPKSLKILEAKQEYQRQEDFLFILQKISEVLTLEVDLQKILTDIATIVGAVLGAKWVNFWELTPDKKAVHIVAAYGMKPEYMEHSRKEPIRLGTAWIGRAVKTGRAWSTSDILSDPKLFKELGSGWEKAIKKQDYRALLCIPLFSRKVVIGGMCLYYPEVHQFTDFEMRLMTVVGNQAATAVANTKTLKELIGERTATLNILDDVEEARTIAEEEKNKTLTIINNFADGLLVFDKENKLLLVNPQAKNFLKIKTNEIEGKLISELSEYPNLKSLIDLLGKQIKSIFRKELSIKENLILEISTISITRDKEGVGNLVILHDISREKMIERIKTEFVSLAAHQLRTPLSAIKWTLKMLLDGDLGKITKEQKEFIEKSYQSNERMILLINDLLDITRMEEGRYLYRPVLTDFENMVYSVANSYQEEITRKKIVLDFKKPETKLPRIAMDAEKMRLVVQNLLENAVKYSLSGSKITILLKYDKDKKEIMFVIKDNGIGIPQDQQTRVFTKFFRGANVIRIETEGTGLGLFISKNIIEAHGGKIWFESEEKKGTTFYFTMPIKKRSGRF